MTREAEIRSNDTPEFLAAQSRRGTTRLRFVTDAHHALTAAKRARIAADVVTASSGLQDAVDAARDAGAGWTQIGDALDLRRGNAYKKFRRRPATPLAGAPGL